MLPLRNMMLFPGVVAPVSVGRESSRKLVQQAVKSGSLIAVTTQLDSTVETPTAKDLYPIGVVAKVMRVIELPDGVLTVILQSYSRFRLGEVTRMKPYMRMSRKFQKSFRKQTIVNIRHWLTPARTPRYASYA